MDANDRSNFRELMGFDMGSDVIYEDGDDESTPSIQVSCRSVLPNFLFIDNYEEK
jgi:hypothetical protein